ncbi:MAG: YfhO family protein, partial [Reichenbachiella sp.]
DFLPHLIAIFVFAAVTALFYSPAILGKKELPQHDIMQWKGGAHEVLEYKNKTGETALWTNSMFSGMPSYLVHSEFESELTVYIHKALSLFFPHPFNSMFLAFLSCYIMLLVFGVRPYLAITGAFAFGLTSFSIISLGAGHNAKVIAVSLMPLILAGVHAAFTKRRLLGFALTALGMALQLRVNHLQITYYLMLMILIYGIVWLVDAIKEKTLADFGKTVAILIVAVVIGVGANIGRLWTISEYSAFSIRGKSELTSTGEASTGLDKDYAFQYSNGIFEPLVMFIPNFFGGTSQQDLGKNSNLEKAMLAQGMSRQQVKQQVQAAPAYWGDQPMTAPYYAGAITVFLFVLGMLVLDKKYRYWLIGVVGFSIMLSWGKNFEIFNYLMFDYLPGYNKFRSVTFAIIMAILAMVIGGFIGLEKLLSSDWNKDLQKKLFIAVGATAGFALLAAVFAGMGSYQGAIDVRLSSYPAWFLEALRADRASLLRVDAFRTLILIVGFVSVIWFKIKGKLSQVLAFSLMAVLVLIDMVGVDKRYLDSDSFKRKSKQTEFSLSEADKVIKNDTDPNYRVLNLINPFNDAVTSYNHKSIGGYHGAKMNRYQDLIERHISPEMQALIADLQSGKFTGNKGQVINMLNAKYFLAGDKANAVIPNQSANGNAWFVGEVVPVSNPDEEIGQLGTIDTKSQAIVNTVEFSDVATIADNTATISLTSYLPNELKYTSSSSNDALAVFSEIYYPKGWKATVDGNKVDILRANYVLRALEIPAGSHEIVFSFEPKSYAIGSMMTWGFNVLLILLVFGSLGLIYFNSNKSNIDIK